MSVRHVVLFKFKDGTGKAREEEAFKALAGLKQKIPVVRSFEGGVNVSEEGRSQGFTHGFVMTMANRQAVREYLAHPEHAKIIEELLPIIGGLVVLDFEV